MKTLTAAELNACLSTTRPMLLHVLPEEHFAARHIAGAIYACSYETAFLVKVHQLAHKLDTPIVVYGEGAPSLDSEDAAARLVAAGYSDVADFRGGLREWEAAGLPLETHAPLPEVPVLDGLFEIDVAASVIRWTGQNLFSFHEGTLKLATGALVLTHGVLGKGGFTIDMTSIACSDLTDSTLSAMLVAHLGTSDFFDVNEHPTASFAMTAATPIAGATEGLPNHMITGDLTIRGVTRELTFPAVIAATDAGHVTAQAHVQLDRTQFGSRYGSGKFFAFLGKHVVNDLFDLHLKIVAVKAGNRPVVAPLRHALNHL